MKLSWNVVLQVLAVSVQAVNSLGGILPAKAQAVIAVVVGVAQGAIGVIAHLTNPDGTVSGSTSSGSLPPAV